MSLLRKQHSGSVLLTWYRKQAAKLDRTDREVSLKRWHMIETWMTIGSQPTASSESRALLVTRLKEDHFYWREQPEARGALIWERVGTANVQGLGDRRAMLDTVDLQRQADSQTFSCSSQWVCKGRVISVPTLQTEKLRLRKTTQLVRGRTRIWIHVLVPKPALFQLTPSCSRVHTRRSQL